MSFTYCYPVNTTSKSLHFPTASKETDDEQSAISQFLINPSLNRRFVSEFEMGTQKVSFV